MKKKMIDNKAGVPIIAVFIVAIIIVAVVGFIAMTGGSTSYWETENEFGNWQDELIINFKDGSSQTLKLIREGVNMPFAVYYEGREIQSIGMKLSAKAEGTGYEGAELKVSNSFGYFVYLYDSNGVSKFDPPVTLYTSDKTLTIPLGNTVDVVGGAWEIGRALNQNPSLYPDGTYSLKYVPKGTAEYRGYPDGGSWITASLPPERSLSVTISSSGGGGNEGNGGGNGGTITVTLSSDVYTT